jgi:hypothetical protein
LRAQAPGRLACGEPLVVELDLGRAWPVELLREQRGALGRRTLAAVELAGSPSTKTSSCSRLCSSCSFAADAADSCRPRTVADGPAGRDRRLQPSRLERLRGR